MPRTHDLTTIVIAWVAALVGVVVLGSSPVAAQDRAQAMYWAQLDIGFPVPKSVLELNPKPVKLRLYAAPKNGKFERVAELGVDQLLPIPNRDPGFQYRARNDGEEEFAVQLVLADGNVSPTTERLRTDFRVVFDTRPPVVNLAAVGQYGVEWTAQDTNIDSPPIRLECRYQAGDESWYEVNKQRGTFSTRDTYSWANSLARDGRVLEVRVACRDRAGHETFSRIVRLPANAGTGVGLGDEQRGKPADTPGLRGGNNFPDDTPNQPQILYVNSKSLTITSKLSTVTRSGVKAVHLWVKNLSGRPGAEWKEATVKTCDIKYDARDPQIDVAHAVPEDGRYGFIVIPESGAGRKDLDPGPSSVAQHLVEVDTKEPVVKVTTITPSIGGSTGTKVEIQWEADDANMAQDPIVLEYAENLTDTMWLPISDGRLPNSRRYIWEVPERTPYKFYVRMRATDKAGNNGEAVFKEIVIVDLEKPSAVIDNVRRSGAPPPSVSDRMPSEGVRPSPAPLPANSSTPSKLPGGPVPPAKIDEKPLVAPDLLKPKLGN